MGVMNRSVQSLHVALPAINQHRLTRCGQQKARDWKSWLYCPTQWCSKSKKKNMMTTWPSLSHEIMKSGDWNQVQISNLQATWWTSQSPTEQIGKQPQSNVSDSSLNNRSLLKYVFCSGAGYLKLRPASSGVWWERRRRGLTRDRPEGWQSVCWANPVMDALWMDITQCCHPTPPAPHPPPPGSLHQIGKIQSAEG